MTRYNMMIISIYDRWLHLTIVLLFFFRNRALFGHVTGKHNLWRSQYIDAHRLNIDVVQTSMKAMGTES